MAKIWQVDFTTYSGSSDVLYDLVGTQHLAYVSGTLNKQSPVIGFNVRQGQLFGVNGIQQRYFIHDGGAINLTNARFTTTYNYRTFTMWIYPLNMGNASFWEGAGLNANIWGGAGIANDLYSGIGATDNGNTIIVRSNVSTILSHNMALSNDWHCITLTVDRLTPKVELFIDGYSVASTNTVFTTVATNEVIGDTGTSNEASYYLGECATYDTILSPSEILAIYDSGLKDLLTTSGVPYQSISGTAYGLDGLPVSGASVYLIYEPTNSIQNYTTTSGDGSYYLDLLYSGAYTLVTTLPPYSGSRAIPLVATSGSVYFL